MPTASQAHLGKSCEQQLTATIEFPAEGFLIVVSERCRVTIVFHRSVIFSQYSKKNLLNISSMGIRSHVRINLYEVELFEPLMEKWRETMATEWRQVMKIQITRIHFVVWTHMQYQLGWDSQDSFWIVVNSVGGKRGNKNHWLPGEYPWNPIIILCANLPILASVDVQWAAAVDCFVCSACTEL